GPPQPPGEQYLLGLYDPDGLSNGGRLPIVLAMTCLTSGFHQPAFSGTTLDERLLLSPGGGAVAVWGPAGLGVAHGHDALLRGFLAGLRAAPGTATLGELTLAGYGALRADAALGRAGDLSALRTYVLLGDPLTPARVLGAEGRVALPLVQR
ncbi:MAG TPA: C25 family cysteine peptidase, partial [Chloroflexaceae bacterium]|nr:C25 family cysteine peptidase [Chloroflexaceae bacterium]